MEKENLCSLPIVLVFSVLYCILSLGKSAILVYPEYMAWSSPEYRVLMFLISKRIDKNLLCYLA